MGSVTAWGVPLLAEASGNEIDKMPEGPAQVGIDTLQHSFPVGYQSTTSFNCLLTSWSDHGGHSHLKCFDFWPLCFICVTVWIFQIAQYTPSKISLPKKIKKSPNKWPLSSWLFTSTRGGHAVSSFLRKHIKQLPMKWHDSPRPCLKPVLHGKYLFSLDSIAKAIMNSGITGMGLGSSHHVFSNEILQQSLYCYHHLLVKTKQELTHYFHSQSFFTASYCRPFITTSHIIGNFLQQANASPVKK